MEYKDYYKILGVSKDASQDDLRKAYRRLARKHHPDVNPNDTTAEERFKELNEAYEVLKDPEKRRKYDQLGADWQRYQQSGGSGENFDWTQWFSQGAPGGGAGYTRTEYVDVNDLFGEGGFSDFFQTIFGGAGAQGQARRASHPGQGYFGQGAYAPGRDIEQAVEVTLEEAFHGATRILEIGQRRLEIKIPRGVRTGSRVRVAHEGQQGYNGGQPGDIYLVITVREHPVYQRDGNNLRMTLPVDLYTLVLGGEVVVTTLKGRVSLKIPPETKSDQVFRLKGQGMPSLRDPAQFGDLYVALQPQLPADLSEREKQLYQELAELRKARA